MASPSWRTATTIEESLFQEPYRFDFFQAVRMLEWISREHFGSEGQTHRAAASQNARPNQIVRFRVNNSFSFPASTIADITKTLPAGGTTEKWLPPQMEVNFFGLTGPSGVMPEHYTELLIRRMRLKDCGLRDFFDIFNHRSLWLFFRAWEKYRFPFAWERAHVDGSGDDPFTGCLRCLVGLGTPSLNDRLKINDDVVLYYSGHFANGFRSALSLEFVLSDYLNLRVRVLQFQGHWLELSPDEQTRLPGRECPHGQYHQLGHGAIIGGRVWDVRSRFHLRIENLNYVQFVRLMPGGEDYVRLGQVTRLYVGLEFSFAIQPVLAKNQIPGCGFVRDRLFDPQLGWNAWLSTAGLVPEVDAAVFPWNDDAGVASGKS